MPDYNALKKELATDPLARGYAGMTDQEAADSLNAKDRTRNRSSVRGSEIMNALVPSEFDSLLATVQDRVKWITQLGESVDVRPGTNVRAILVNAFGPGTTTRDNLVNIVQVSISRAEEIGFGATVTANHVAVHRG